jgi:hypothetical protein
MAKELKCYGTCEKKYPEEQLEKFQNKNHCAACFSVKAKEVADREALYKSLQKTFNLTFPTGNMLRQIKLYKTERGYTYKNIMFTVNYMFFVKKVYKPDTKYGIAAVPHFYDEMIAYYKDLKKRREETVVEETKIITIKMKPMAIGNTYREKKFINMEELLK